jgi:anti-sigma regulatory factor (Ser/Thr protein kinase)
MKEPIALAITEDSQVGEIRRIATALASQLGFNETECSKVAIVVTEAAKNLVKHASNGEVLLRSLKQNDTSGIEILALDKGQGMANLHQCLQDGFSTAGSPGTGLGAISRLSSFFDIHSIPEVGTALVAHLWSQPLPKARSADNLEIGVVCKPITGEEVCGDAWSVYQSSGKSLVLVADGLGHGPGAAEASQRAVSIFQENASLSPKEIIEAAHAALRGTRGTAMAIAQINHEELSVQFAGVGNISGAIVTPQESRSMVSYNGTVGHQIFKIQEFTYAWAKDALLVMHSDGLATQWRIDRYIGLTARHPSLAAGVLYRDFQRGRDDVTVLVAREEN